MQASPQCISSWKFDAYQRNLLKAKWKNVLWNMKGHAFRCFTPDDETQYPDLAVRPVGSTGSDEN